MTNIQKYDTIQTEDNCFSHNADGIRTSKTKNGVTTTYYLSGSQIVAEETSGNVTVYLYDASGSPAGMQYHASSYAEDDWDIFWYEKNLQGDIVAVYSEAGTKLVSYTYDAWGSFSRTYHNGGSSTVAGNNPFLYRGYYYDKDLQLYYLNARYYDPAIGRFINADDTAMLGANGDFASLNLYSYCGNNPVYRVDENGEAWNIAIGALVGGLFELGSQLISNDGDISDINWNKVAIATIVGGITAICGPVSGAIISGIGNVAMECVGGTSDATKLGASFLIGAGASMVGYGLGVLAKKVGGKIALNRLSKKTPGQIKQIVNKVIDVAGRDRNKVKNLSWAISQDAYKHLPYALVGKSIPQIFNSIGVGISGYGTMGVVYGFK